MLHSLSLSFIFVVDGFRSFVALRISVLDAEGVNFHENKDLGLRELFEQRASDFL